MNVWLREINVLWLKMTVGKLRQGLHARIPRLFIDFLGELLSRKLGMLLHPPVCFHNLFGIRGGCEDLGNQRIRIQGDGRHELLQLLGGLGRRLSR
jgi:hypothetical protein